MNNKININPSSTKWLEKDDRVVADYFCDLGFRSLKQILSEGTNLTNLENRIKRSKSNKKDEKRNAKL